jgi:uncharacterized membrane protein YgcG
MRRILIFTSLFLAAIMAYGSDCDSLILDRAHVLQGKESAIMQALDGIKAKGGDPRVVTDNPSSDTPEQYVHNVQRACPSWQSADGGVKNNLIVFLVFPQRHKVGLFIGQEFAAAINTSAIRSQSMGPAFKDGDWARGFINGAKQAAIQIEAFQTASLHPNTTVIDEKPTDLHGLWIFLYCLIGLAVAGGGIWAFLGYRKRKEEQTDAQQAAVLARNDAAVRIRKNSDSPDAEDFARMMNSETWNPEADNLSADQYRRIANAYSTIARPKPQPPAQKPPRQKKPQDTGIPVAQKSAVGNSTYVDRRTTIINNDPGYVPMPVIIEEPPVVYERERYEPKVREESSSSYSGGSSDFGSSSSWSDSSSSSDFGSSSSDFSGGSSDF